MDRVTELLKLLQQLATGPAGLAVFAAAAAAFLAALYWRHEARQTAAMERIALELHQTNDRLEDIEEHTGKHRTGDGGRR